jgi:hypothetical protein
LAVFVKGKKAGAKTAQPSAKPAAAQPGVRGASEAALKNSVPVPALTDAEVDQVLSGQN